MPTDLDAIASGRIDTDALATDAVTAAKIVSGAIGTSELDLSITPTWTGSHTFNSNTFIDDGNGIVVGDTSKAVIGPQATETQILGDSGTDSSLSLGRYASGDAFGSQIRFGKSRSGTVGSAGTAVQTGDVLSTIRYHGDDGTDLNTDAAVFEVIVDDTVAANQVPGRFELRTADSAGSLTEAVRIDSNQDVIVQNGRVNFNAGNANDTNDSMTANPESDTESGFIEIEVNGTTKQVPFYDP